MNQKNAVKLFENQNVRVIWDDRAEQYYFSIVDVVRILTESPNPRKYWSVLKTRLKAEGSELATNCSQLKMPSRDGKMYLTDVADTEQVLRLPVLATRSPSEAPMLGMPLAILTTNIATFPALTIAISMGMS